jgi:hypothetical protein
MIILLRMCAPNGERYPRVGGTRQRHFDGTNFKPRKLLENAATPTRRVHALLGSLLEATMRLGFLSSFSTLESFLWRSGCLGLI